MGFLGAAMKKLILIILLSFVAGGTVLSSLNVWYFEYRTGMPLLEVFEIKTNCEEHSSHCWFVYYFVPDKAIRSLDFEEPEGIEL